MAARLILNADDFGLTHGVNRAIAELHDAGALPSTTLMATGAAFEDAVSLAMQRPGLGVGCHILLVDGSPVSSPETIPTLLGPDRRMFHPSLSGFLLRLFQGLIDPADIQREVLAQIAKLRRNGLEPTHLDTHKHTHIWPTVARPLLAAAATAGIAAVRNPFEEPWSISLGSGSLLRSAQVRLMRQLRPRFLALPQIASGRIRTTDGTIGIAATGSLRTHTLAALLAAIPPGTWELCCHPGYNDADLSAVKTVLRKTREVEREALSCTFGTGSAKPFAGQLISYANLIG